MDCSSPGWKFSYVQVSQIRETNGSGGYLSIWLIWGTQDSCELWELWMGVTNDITPGRTSWHPLFSLLWKLGKPRKHWSWRLESGTGQDWTLDRSTVSQDVPIEQDSVLMEFTLFCHSIKLVKQTLENWVIKIYKHELIQLHLSPSSGTQRQPKRHNQVLVEPSRVPRRCHIPYWKLPHLGNNVLLVTCWWVCNHTEVFCLVGECRIT